MISDTLDSNEPLFLDDRWTLYFHDPDDPLWTVNSYKQIGNISTVEDFIEANKAFTDMWAKGMFFLMREHIQPLWEDPYNKNGGCFSYKVIEKNVPITWKKLCYLISGQTISANKTFSSKVTGITISPKKKFCIIKIWMNDCENQNPELITNELKDISPQGCLFKKHAPEY